MKLCRFFFVLLFCSGFAYAQDRANNISLEDLFKNYIFSAKGVPGFNAMKDGLHYTQLDRKDTISYINIYNLQTGEKNKTIFNNDLQRYKGHKLAIESYELSEDEQKILLFTEEKHIYRRSAAYEVYVYDIGTGKLQLVDEDKILHATMSPDGGKVAYVKDNNLYYKDFASGKITAVTKDGRKNSIINGNCDWVYEEEFEFTRAFSWSPDGAYIAYYRFDESKVPEYTITYYDSLYPTLYTYKYPKAGEPNSIIQIRMYNVASGQTVNADIGKETDQYIPRIKWTTDPSKLCIYRLNRLQNKLELLLADVTDGSSSVIYEEKNKYFININDELAFLPDGHSFIFSSERDGYQHLYLWNWHEQTIKLLTKGNYDVAELVGVDKERKEVYYTAAVHSPMERKLYVVDWNGEHGLCLTPEEGVHDITPCTGYKYFLDRYSTLKKVPVYYLRDADGAIIRTLEDNKELATKIKGYSMGDLELTKVYGVNDTLNAWMLTPPDFDKNKKYPVLMYQYSGPGSQQVIDRFPGNDFFWYQMLAEKGYIIVCADGIGTGFRGEAFRKKTYLQLGKYESDDQIAVAKYLGTLPYIDKSRIGIWGWSYGGFMSATCILKGNDVFKMAIAVAPVTNWRYYDNIYTERYMRTPQENPQGYDDNAPEKMASRLKGKFLVIQGTADDNVHFQNSVMLVNALIKANKDFDGEYYPNRNHGIYGGNTRLHLYHRMTEFIFNNL